MWTPFTLLTDLSACNRWKYKVSEMDLVFDTAEFSQTGNKMLKLILKFLNFGLVKLYIHVYTHICKKYMYIYKHIHTYVPTYVHTYTHIHTHTHRHTHIYIMYIYTHIYIYIPVIHVCVTDPAGCWTSQKCTKYIKLQCEIQQIFYKNRILSNF
jgi:hypothetical protein